MFTPTYLQMFPNMAFPPVAMDKPRLLLDPNSALKQSLPLTYSRGWRSLSTDCSLSTKSFLSSFPS